MLSLLLFCIGLYGVLTRRNAIGILMSIELMLNAGALNFAIFNRLMSPEKIDGELMGIFIIVIAAAEAVIGMAIFVAVFQQRNSLDVTQMDTLKG
ncbi:MAG: NADH-quinone oxidoreductase subunit NuoK [SAR324 cluster bacterium]|nr:NADH-quinone oxidoreductase subunit NuoK [SAR324 cluster bacterium]